MGRQIIKQPDGLYAIWSAVADNFILTDVTPEEIIEYDIEVEAKQIRARIKGIISQLEKGEKPYYQFTMTWDEAQARKRRD